MGSKHCLAGLSIGLLCVLQQGPEVDLQVLVSQNQGS